MDHYELRLRAEWAALKAEESGFKNTSDALLEIAQLYLPKSKPESFPSTGKKCLDRTNKSGRKTTPILQSLTIP